MALGMGVNTKSVQGVWNILIERFGSEVAVLVDADIRGSGVDNRVIDAIIALREGKVTVHPGGGGQYGRIELTDTEPCARNEPGPQKSLFEFVL